MSRPFDRDRSGMVLGEGGGAVILEELESAQARGARIFGEVLGHGSSTVVEGSFLARIDRALENAMKQALGEACLEPHQVGHVHAHGLSTRQGDIEEAQAIRRVFSNGAEDVPVVAAKSHLGNVGASGGTMELIASLMAFQQQKLFPVLNYENPDPECPVAAVTSADVSPGDSVLNLSYCPTGQATAVVVRAFS
jgi:3-oxoacyl-[acyl-carrier-protein] synthase II